MLLIILGLGGCDSPERAWEIADRDDTPTAYLEFLAKYPESEYVDLARARIESLTESRAWERTQFRNTLAGYTTFVEQFPDSAHVTEAQNRILGIHQEDAWAIAQDADSAAVVAAFLRDYPDAPQATRARELLAVLEAPEVRQVREEPEKPAEPRGDFRLQLASFRTARAADTELRRLVALFPDALPRPIKIQTPGIDDKSPMFVLKSVPMSWNEAQTVCTKLVAMNQACLIINR